MTTSRIHSRHLIGLLALIGGICFITSDTILAQKVAIKEEKKATGKEKEEMTDAFNVPLDREASNKIEAVKAYLDKPMVPWDQIVPALQKLLEQPEDTFVEVERVDPKSGQNKKTKVSVRAEVNRIIGSFKEEGRQYYQLKYGPEADEMLKRAGETGDKQILANVVERYLHTKAGSEAVVQLGSWYLDRGRYMMAALTFEKLRFLNQQSAVPPQTLFKVALAWKRLGDKDTAESYFKKLKEVVGRSQVTMGTIKVTIDQMEAEYNRAVTGIQQLDQSEWSTFFGGLNRNARGVGGRPFLEPRFSYSLLTAANEEEAKSRKTAWEWVNQNLEQATKQFEQRQSVPLQMFFPVASKGKILFRTYDGVHCLFTKEDKTQDPPITPGELSWCYRCEHSLLKMVDDPGKKQTFQDQWWRQFYLQNGPYGIFFENGLIGTMSHDGTNVYFVDDIAVPPHPQMIANFGMSGQQVQFGAQFTDWVYHSKLVAINMETGSLRWKAGGRNPAAKTDEKKPETAVSLLSDCHFLGAPLPLAGKLYVLIEKDRELRLVCLDPNRTTKIGDSMAHPELVWSQPLGTPNNYLPQDSIRRIQGVHLAYSDGILVCPTNAGAVLGIDLLSHSLLWAHSYREGTPINQPNMGGPGMGGMPVPQRFGGGYNGQPILINQDRWRACTPIISNGKVVFTAYDSASLQCLDLRTGELLWKSQRAANDLYVAGIFDDKVLVVGKSTLRFLNLNSKDIKGERIGADISIPTPSGVGTASGQKYFLPIKSSPDTLDPEIWTIDVAKGMIEAKTKSRKKIPTGNLLFFEGDVYSQTADKITAFPQLDIKIEEMRRRLVENPNDPVGLAEQGDLLLDDGKLMEAITTLKKAKTFNPPDTVQTRIREKLYEAISELLQQDFDKGEPFLDEYKDLCQIPVPSGNDAVRNQRAADEQLRRESNRFLLVAKGREKQGKLLEAFENYLAFGTLPGNKDLISATDQPNTSARPDVWARGRITSMITKASPDQRKPLEEKINSEWMKVKESNDLAKIRGFVRVFGGFFGIGNEARLLLAEKLVSTNNEDDMREAQNILLSLSSADETIVAARATEGLARLYIRKGLLEDAVYMYSELNRRFENQIIQDGKTGADYFADLVTDKRFLPYLEPLRTNWPTRMKAEESTSQGVASTGQAFSLDPEGESLPFYARHRIVMETNFRGQNVWGFKVFDRTSGELRYQSDPLPMNHYYFNVPSNTNYKYAFVRGHLMIVSIMNKVYAFDLADRKKLWEYDLLGKNPYPNNIAPQQIPEEDGGLRLIYADGWTQKLGQVGVIQSTYVCLITRDGLVALDPARGVPLWTKSGVSPRVQLVGDENLIYIFEQNQDGSPAPLRVIRASDGVSVEGIPDCSGLFDKQQRWKVFGRNLLVFEEKGSQKSFRLYDMLKGKDVWKKDLDAKSIPIRADDANLIGYISAQGTVEVFDTRSGNSVFKSKLDEKYLKEHMDKVTDATLLADRERVYVVLNRPLPNGFFISPSFQFGVRMAKVNGVMYCFDKQTGKRKWFEDKDLENQMLILEQFQELPVIIAAVQYNTNNGGYGTHVFAMNKDTGKAIFGPKEMGQNTQFQSFNVDQKTSTIELLRHDIKIRIRPEKAPAGGSTTISTTPPSVVPNVQPPMPVRLIK